MITSATTQVISVYYTQYTLQYKKQYAEVHSQTIGLTSSPTQNKVFVEQDVEALSSTSCENK